MKKGKKFQIAKVQPQGIAQLSYCLIFCQFEPGVTYMKCCLQKSVYIQKIADQI